MQCGWYKEVRVKDLDSHAIKALLVSRALIVKIKRDIENQIRGFLKNLNVHHHAFDNSSLRWLEVST
jgi:hypothetical protein